MNSIKKRNIINVVAILGIIFCMFLIAAISADAIEATATAKVNAKGGAYLRKTASTKAKQVKLLKNNAKITIQKEVFTAKKKYNASNKWYYIKTAKGKKGYIRSDLVDTIKYTEVKAQATDALNYRFGAGTGMEVKSTFKNYDLMTIVLKSYPKNSSELWYKIKKGSKYYYVCASFVTTNIREKPSEDQILAEEVARVKKIKSINDMALALAWPYGTESVNYSFSKGSATPIYSAIHSEWPKRTKTVGSYGSGPMLGASCDRFVGCVIWACGADVNFPSGSGFKASQQGGYMAKHPELWQPLEYTGDTSMLKAGDIVTYSKNKDGSGAHILIVVKINGQLAIAEAALNSTYPHINTDLNKISATKYSTYKKKAVYRLVK